MDCNFLRFISYKEISKSYTYFLETYMLFYEK
jgi:hypothetical protein